MVAFLSSVRKMSKCIAALFVFIYYRTSNFRAKVLKLTSLVEFQFMWVTNNQECLQQIFVV